MSAPGTVTASGERSVAVGGDVHGVIVTGDNVRVVIRDGGRAGMLLDALGLRRVRTRARRAPFAVRPPSFADRVDREAEANALRAGGARVLSVVGEEHVGKTYVVAAAFGEDGSGPAPHGIVYVHGRGRPLPDLLQRLWEELYESRPPSVPSEAALLRDLADREVLVVVDSCELEHDEAQALAAALPRSRIVLVSRERRWWDGEELPVGGLRDPDALALLARDLGAPIPPAEEAAAAGICRALDGHPLRIRQAAGLARRGVPLVELAALLSGPDPAGSLAAAAVSRASPPELDVIAALAPFSGEPVGARHVEALAGPGGGDAAGSLADRGLALRGSPRFALALPDARVVVGAERLAAAETAAAEYALDLEPEDVVEELPALLVLLHRLAEAGRHAHVVRLGRLLAPALVQARRLAGWRSTADAVLEAALAVGDLDAQAWALHESGTHALALDDAARGGELLGRALTLRERLGDDSGVRATAHNLRLLGGPPWYLRRVGQLPLIVLALALALPLAAGGVGAAVVLTRDDGGAATEQPTTAPTAGEQMLTEPTTPTDTAPEATTGTATVSEVEVRVAPPVEGAGTIVSGDGRITCPDVCASRFAVGQEVVLTATTGEGFVFLDWGHASCTDPEAPCALPPLERSEVVQPRFEPGLRLTVEVEGRPGAVRVEPPGETCEESPCPYTLARGTTVTLTPVERESWTFMAWEAGQCEGETPCSFVLEEDASVLAVFRPPVPLTVTVAGDGEGSVTSRPPGIDCSAGSCTASFRFGETVVLTAAPRERSFVIWRGEDCTGNECTLAMTQRRAVTANFNPPID
jgi:hypothetical protein